MITQILLQCKALFHKCDRDHQDYDSVILLVVMQKKKKKIYMSKQQKHKLF